MASLDSKKWLRKACNAIYNDQIFEQVIWDDSTLVGQPHLGALQGSLFSDTSTSPDFAEAPKSWVKNLISQPNWKELNLLVETCLSHSDSRKHQHLYSLLKKFIQNPQVLKNPLESDLQVLRKMEKQISRDIHKMRAFVRFREVDHQGRTIFYSFYEPDHDILLKNAPFFKSRFSTMNWVITTPSNVMAWNGEELLYQEGCFSEEQLPQDTFEELWKTYYQSTFNPARLKIKMMKSEMPTRFWKHLPEAKLIDDLIQNSHRRIEKMKENSEKQGLSAHHYIPNPPTLTSMKKSLPQCQACPLSINGTQPVFSKGSTSAKIMIVGEAPGDQEELKNEAFVGPAGKLLKECLSQIGVDHSKIYFTNAVKHFNFRQRGKLRLHQTPTSQHIMSCRPWLLTEIGQIEPEVIIGLGRSAAQSLLGFPMPIESLRNITHKSEEASQIRITYHPARILREKEEDKKNQLISRFKKDLKEALSLPGVHCPFI